MKHALLSFLILSLVVVTGCGGGGAFGLLGVAAENAFDTDDDPVPPGSSRDMTQVALAGAVEVPAGAPGIGPAPARAFAVNGDALELWESVDAASFARVATGAVSGGAYAFNGPYRARYYKILHAASGHALFLGRVSNDATNVAVPVRFDTLGVILTKTLEKQGALATLVAGSAAHTTLRDAVDQRVRATVNNDLRLALAAIQADDALLTAANLGFNTAEQGFKELIVLGAGESWRLGSVEVQGVERLQVLNIYSNNLFTFTFVGSTDSIFLTGSYTAGTSSVEFTVTSVSQGFPVGVPLLAMMDEVGEKFRMESVAIRSRDHLQATLAGRSVTLVRQTPR